MPTILTCHEDTTNHKMSYISDPRNVDPLPTNSKLAFSRATELLTKFVDLLQIFDSKLNIYINFNLNITILTFFVHV